MANSDDKDAIKEENRAVWDDYVKDMRPELEDDIQEEDFQALLDSVDVSEEVLSQEKACSPQREEFAQDRARGKASSRSAPPQLDKRTQERLRKGRMPIEGRLDLHGMTRVEAHENLSRFLVGCHAQGLRCVLVITGKGKSNSTSDDWLLPPKGILKENVPVWLSSSPLKEIILKFFTAQPKDGGSGALYIYLKRKR